MVYVAGAVERAMKVQEVILRALSGQLTWLQAADILDRSPRSIRREPRPCLGELLHLDGSRHRWLALVPDQYLTLIAVVDDATKQVLYAALSDGGESTAAVMMALRAVLTTWGLPMALYTVPTGPRLRPPPGGRPIPPSSRKSPGRWPP